MSYRTPLQRLGCLVAAPLCSFAVMVNAAQAQTTASLDLQLNYSLFDLNPLDGLAPSITFADGTTNGATWNWTASVGAGEGGQSFNINDLHSFSVGANTMVVFFMSTTASAQPADVSGWQSSHFAPEAYVGSMGLQVHGTGALGTGTQNTSASQNGVASQAQMLDVRWNDTTGAEEYLMSSALPVSSTGVLQGSFINLTGGALDGEAVFNGFVMANDYRVTTPVPEPATGLMSLAGLGLLALRYRRRRAA
ncbi:MAG: PEP-CTERM sorting domain-containing protein [Burkholderiales bacterium]|nr:PEP-CTERM sorting domain-containing protein [Burkholderiales bacterium]